MERPSARTTGVTWRELFTGPRGRLLIGLMLAEIATAMQMLVVVSILPLITRELHGTALYGLAAAATTLATFLTIPLAGPFADRYGLRRALTLAFLLVGAGAVIAGAAPSMPVVVAGRLIQGLGAGAQAAIALTGVAQLFPERQRPRVLVLTSSSWVVPSLIGPSYGTLLATWFSWRVPLLLHLAFIAAAAALAIPALARLSPPVQRASTFRPAASILLFAGATLAIAGFEQPGAYGVAAGVVGVVLVAVAARRLLPPGTLRLRRGLPMTAASALFVSLAFYSSQAALPVLLTGRAGLSLRVASFAVTAGSLLWSLGTFLQSRLAERDWRISTSARIGGCVLVLGVLGIAAGGLTGNALPVFVLWALGGIGMGLTYASIWLNTMTIGKSAGTAISATLLMFTIGMAFGNGVAGISISLGSAHHAIATGIVIMLCGVALVAALVPVFAARLASPPASDPPAERPAGT